MHFINPINSLKCQTKFWTILSLGNNNQATNSASVTIEGRLTLSNFCAFPFVNVKCIALKEHKIFTLAEVCATQTHLWPILVRSTQVFLKFTCSRRLVPADVPEDSGAFVWSIFAMPESGSRLAGGYPSLLWLACGVADWGRGKIISRSLQTRDTLSSVMPLSNLPPLARSPWSPLRTDIVL